MICRKANFQSKQIFQEYITKYWYIIENSLASRANNLKLLVQENKRHSLKNRGDIQISKFTCYV